MFAALSQYEARFQRIERMITEHQVLLELIERDVRLIKSAVCEFEKILNRVDARLTGGCECCEEKRQH